MMTRIHQATANFYGRRRGRRPPKLGRVPKAKVATRDTEVTVIACYKNSRIKQYLSTGAHSGIETVINSPDHLLCQRRLVHLEDYETEWAPMRAAVYSRLGMTAETLGKWVRQAEVDVGQEAGMTTHETQELRELRNKNKKRLY
jgi:hypothetical protein